MGDDGIEQREREMIGGLVRGRVEAVFRWGVIVDLGMSRPGLIDALYVENDDRYEAGDVVEAHLECFDEMKQEFILRPPSQTSIGDRLQAKGFDLD
ncbi:hypothetical protein [Allorhizocola rhizosphaerae]|uniref:hypothetical protein n=1 Tax=Allorhizocola rhizosphaerae TaxID=1872709 RepID=UPI0013C3140F|nr:hypothetical protein [Allorhizocola rhizosphaerae]